MASAYEAKELVQLVRGGDYERFLAIQLAPVAVRPALYTVLAVSVELARIAEAVSEPFMGHIRLAWWREALEEIEADKPPRRHPVVQALAALYPAHAMMFLRLYEMIAARAADMDTSLIAQEGAWLDYCDKTAGSLHLALAQILDPQAAIAHEAAIRAHGQAYAMIGLACAIPFMTGQGWLRFPHARLNAYGAVSLEPSAATESVVAQVVEDAQGRMRLVRLPRVLKSLQALAAVANLRAVQLQKAGNDPYRLRPRPLAAIWRVMWVNIR